MNMRNYNDFVKDNKSTVENKEVKENTINMPKYIGNCIYFPRYIKISDAFNVLKENKISVDKLKFILIQDNNSFITAKYDETDIFNLGKFTETLLLHYKNEGLSFIDEIDSYGNNVFSVIKNIPDVNINEVKFGKIIINDIIRLLNKKSNS